jgi:hypothetical protein
VGRIFQRLCVCFAFAMCMLAPAMSRAALLPACEARDQLTRMPVEWMLLDEPSQPTDVCDAGAPAPSGPTAEDLGDTRYAAMCDERGASVIAPQRILPISDARIEAVPSCAFDDATSYVGPSHRHAPVAPPGATLADHAVLDPQVLVPPASSEPGPPFPPPTGGVRPGFVRGILRPPRG